MTLAPSVEARGVEGKRAERNHLCAAPGCISLSQHGHHIWPRSYLRSQPTEWVRLPDGRVVSNVVGLCVRHHDQVTGGPGGHKARIEYVAGSFVWYSLTNDGEDGLLFPQPGAPPHPGRTQAERHTDLAPGESCPTCGYTKPRPSPGGPKRNASTWTVNVPLDAELGGEVLDDWVETFASVLGLDTKSQRLLRYHVLAVVLAWASQRLPEFIADVRESRDAA